MMGVIENVNKRVLGARTLTKKFICVADKWWGSFPKVGIVIPNPVAWILPEIANMASSARVILDFPVPRGGPQLGARVAPTSDGFVIWLPSLGAPGLHCFPIEDVS